MILLTSLLLFAAPQTSTPPPPPEINLREAPPVEAPEARIQWFGTLEQGLAEAKRTNRPIMMTAAAPFCRGVSGKW
ncbi:MAG: hypothetical protein ACPG31_12530 [Planctomycetota bacterium]